MRLYIPGERVWPKVRGTSIVCAEKGASVTCLLVVLIKDIISGDACALIEIGIGFGSLFPTLYCRLYVFPGSKIISRSFGILKVIACVKGRIISIQMAYFHFIKK